MTIDMLLGALAAIAVIGAGLFLWFGVEMDDLDD